MPDAVFPCLMFMALYVIEVGGTELKLQGASAVNYYTGDNPVVQMAKTKSEGLTESEGQADST